MNPASNTRANPILRGRVVPLVAAVTALAAAVRLATLTRQSLDNDEAYTVALTQHSFGGLLSLFRIEANGLLYPLVDWPIVRVSGGLAALRSPALVAGVIAIPLVFLVGKEIAGPRVALLGATLMALNPDAIAQSQNARGYAFALMLALVSYLALLRARRGDRRWWLIYVLATALAGYAQILALCLVPIGQIGVALGSGKRFIVAWLKALGVTAILAGPAIVLALSEASRRNPLYWLDPPHLGSAIEFLLAFTVGTLAYKVAPDGSTNHLTLVPAIVPLLWLLIIGAGLWRSRKAGLRLSAGSSLVVLLAWTALPALALFLVSQVKPMFFPSTYLITSLPGACLLVVAAAESLPPKWNRAAVTLVLAVSVIVTALAATHRHGADYRAVGRWLESNRARSTPLVIDPLQRVTALGYYDSALRIRGRLVVPEWKESSLPAGVSGYEGRGSYSPGILGPPTPATISPVIANSPTGGLVMVVELSPNRQGDVTQSSGVRWLQRNCDTRRRTYTGLLILVVARCR
jgi:4-amino-4-deoxy-L-arabinose transferase-like glycosyltransferase